MTRGSHGRGPSQLPHNAGGSDTLQVPGQCFVLTRHLPQDRGDTSLLPSGQ